MGHVLTHVDRFAGNRRMGVETVASASDTVFPIKRCLIQGKECAVVDRASVYYSEM